MSRNELSPGELNRARKIFYLWALFNALSFNLLGGNIITLYALRLGAGTFLIGLLASFIPLVQIMPLLGRTLVSRMGTTRLMATFWVIRYLVMIPILFAPLLIRREDASAALTLCVITVLCFQIARGIGITGFNPLIGGLTGGEDRGSFISRHFLISYLGCITVGVSMGLLLGQNAPLGMYTVFMSAGIVLGLISSFLLFKLPEMMPGSMAKANALLANVVRAVKRKPFRRFMVAQLFASFIIAMIGPFLILFMKQAYLQPDRFVIYFTVIGLGGAILVSLVSGTLVDRLGAKPLYFLFASIILLVIIPAIIAPPLQNPLAVWFFAGAIFFIFNLGVSGLMISGQVYFFSSIAPEERLNLGILSQMSSGLSAALGSVVGGALLEKLQSTSPYNAFEPFRFYFAVPFVLFLILLFLISRLERMGAYSVRSSLSFIFSPRDLKAITLLKKLGKSKTEFQEQKVIKALGESQSSLSSKELIQKLASPRFKVRAEALRALNYTPLDRAVENALISEVKNHQFTTAYMAAEILGERGIRKGIQALRNALSSQDFFLCGKAMVALASLGDGESLPNIETLIRISQNPRIIIHGARSLEMFRSSSSIPLLILKLKQKAFPYVRDEIILSISEILGMGDFFYPPYNEFLARNRAGVLALKDIISEREQKGLPCKTGCQQLYKLLQGLNKPDFGKQALGLLNQFSVTVEGSSNAGYLMDALRSFSVVKLERFRFLVAAFIIWFSFQGSPS